MTSYLTVAFYGCRTILKIHSSQHSIFPESMLDIQNCLLQPSFFFNL